MMNAHESIVNKSSSNNGHLALKCFKIRLFRAFSLLRDVNMMLRIKRLYFSYSKQWLFS